ncbi:MAG: phosphoribulokinase, partial [Propionibacteriaceae bacterium]|nr:phosphoribulokinase [Propionibacteriaceae bacterium]
MKRADSQAARPVMLAVGGDSGSGKTTLTRGLVDALGPDQCVSVCLDDYHRYDRAARARLPFTVSHPDANYLDIAEQHLQMLATGQPVLKPVYDHRTGTFGAMEYLQPRPFVIVEGLFPLFSPLSRACFDIKVMLDPPEDQRRAWKITRDTTERGYTVEQVLADLAAREADSAEFIRPQRRHADIVVRITQDAGQDDPLLAEVLLRGTVPRPPLANILVGDANSAMSLTIIRDSDGTPVDCLRVRGDADPAEIARVQQAIWDNVDSPSSSASGPV